MLLACAVSCFAALPPQTPTPSAPQRAWQAAEVVAMFTLDPRICYQDKPQLGNIHNVHYGEERAREYAAAFNPAQLATDQWLACAKDMGATAAVLVAKHEVGFCLWQSDANPYCLKMLSWRDGKGDIVADFVASCRRFGIKPGLFTTTRFDNRLGINNSVPMQNASITREAYNRLVEAETAELLSRYGDLFMLWLDGAARTPAQGGPDLLPIFRKHQPSDAIYYHSDERRDIRWGGNENGVVGDPCWSTVNDAHQQSWGQGHPDGRDYCPAMADTPLGRDWFWRRDGNRGIKSQAQLQRIYESSVGRNATLVIGLTPDTRGLLPDSDVLVCRAFGDWIRSVAKAPPINQADSQLVLEVPAALREQELLVTLAEDLAQGERVREYVLEGQLGAAWQPLMQGRSIGHKRILRPAKGNYERLRLRVLQSVGEPILAEFSLRRATLPVPTSSFARALRWQGFAIDDPAFTVWGASPIAVDGTWHLFAARWPEIGVEPAWRKSSEIAQYSASQPQGPYHFQRVVLAGTGQPGDWDAFGAHNPEVRRCGDQFVLLYIANSDFHQPPHPGNQQIGMLVADSVHGPWHKVGSNGLILGPSNDPAHFSHGRQVVNPTLLQLGAKFHLYYKTSGHERGTTQYGVAIADSLVGPYVHASAPITGDGVCIEDATAFAWHDKICLLTTDNVGAVTGKRGAGALWVSDDGLHFKPEWTQLGFDLIPSYFADYRAATATHIYGHEPKFERPKVLCVNGEPAWLFAASGCNVRGGKRTLNHVLQVRLQPGDSAYSALR